MEIVNIAQKFSMFHELWNPKIVGEINDSYIKLAKLQGEFVWHKHDLDDELFLVVLGRLVIKLRDRDLTVDAGEFVVIPKGVEHCPVATEEVQVILIEPKSVINTGDQSGSERTVTPVWI